MANAIIMCMLKEYIYIKYMFVAGGGSLEPGIILYTFTLFIFCSVLHVLLLASFIFLETPSEV